jgi:hypothetical protein
MVADAGGGTRSARKRGRAEFALLALEAWRAEPCLRRGEPLWLYPNRKKVEPGWRIAASACVLRAIELNQERLNETDNRSTFFGGGAHGYTDYPFLR